jgi:hypothetical protein
MKIFWIKENSKIFFDLGVNQRINLKYLSGAGISILMRQHPDILKNRIKRIL